MSALLPSTRTVTGRRIVAITAADRARRMSNWREAVEACANGKRGHNHANGIACTGDGGLLCGRWPCDRRATHDYRRTVTERWSRDSWQRSNEWTPLCAEHARRTAERYELDI